MRCLLLFMLLFSSPGVFAAPGPPPLFPTPQHIVWGEGRFLLRKQEPVQSEQPVETADFLSQLQKLTGSAHSLGSRGRIRFTLLKQPEERLGEEGYRVQVTPREAAVEANQPAGLFYGSTTLIQLLEREGDRAFLRTVTLEDWPAMAYRGVMVDISRGLVPNLATFQRMIRSLARLKINALQPYIEDTYAFKGYPYIGRDRGAWTPEEVRAMVKVAKQYHVDMSPCFESLGHMGQILKHPQLADLRETGDVITPAKEATYDFLGRCYQELAGAFPFPYLNVGCDETGSLGQGPSKALVDQEGIGKVYAGHLRRLDDLCHQVHRKMQFWGDMMLAYPGIVGEMPKDAIVMNWDYGTQHNFANIGTYKRFGYQQIVCPGIQSWSGMFPNLAGAEGNIRGFIHEGKAAGALGVLNTAWRDNGEVFFDYDWYADAIGAECAWAGAPASGPGFDAGFERAFFGPGSAGLAGAFRRLSQSVSLPGVQTASSTLDLYYSNPFQDLSPYVSRRGRANLEQLAKLAQEIHQLVHSAHPVFNTEALPYLDFGADRLASMGEEYQSAWSMTDLYNRAVSAGSASPREAVQEIHQVLKVVDGLIKSRESLQRGYAELWMQENKEPGLQRVLDRYEPVLKTSRDLKSRLQKALTELEAGRPLPSPAEMGLTLPSQTEWGYRIPARLQAAPPWAGGAALAFHLNLPRPLPVSMPLHLQFLKADLPPDLASLVQLHQVDEKGTVLQTLPCQVDKLVQGRAVLTFFVPAGVQGEVRLALDPAAAAAPETIQLQPAAELKGGYWIQNSRYRALLGPEGAHLYRWDLLSLGGRDMTMPGDEEWHGFDDVGAERSALFTLKPVLRGPLCVQIACEAPDGFAKTLTFYAGSGWYDTRLDSPVDFFWHYDDPAVMGASTAAPGSFRYADGKTGALPKEGSPSEAGAAPWVAKYDPTSFVLGLISPEGHPSLHAGPGGSMGGVGIEGGGSSSHLLTYADKTSEEWKAVADLYQSYIALHSAGVEVIVRH